MLIKITYNSNEEQNSEVKKRGAKVTEEKVPASPDSLDLDKVCDLLMAKLAERVSDRLTSKQGVLSWSLVSRSTESPLNCMQAVNTWNSPQLLSAC